MRPEIIRIPLKLPSWGQSDAKSAGFCADGAMDELVETGKPLAIRKEPPKPPKMLLTE